MLTLCEEDNNNVLEIFRTIRTSSVIIFRTIRTSSVIIFNLKGNKRNYYNALKDE